jgi:hypothetical protein
VREPLKLAAGVGLSEGWKTRIDHPHPRGDGKCAEADEIAGVTGGVKWQERVQVRGML